MEIYVKLHSTLPMWLVKVEMGVTPLWIRRACLLWLTPLHFTPTAKGRPFANDGSYFGGK